MIDWKQLQCIPESEINLCSRPNKYKISYDYWAKMFYTRTVTVFFYSDFSNQHSGFIIDYVLYQGPESQKRMFHAPEGSCEEHQKGWKHSLDNTLLVALPNKNNSIMLTETNYFDIYQNSSRENFADFRKSLFFDQDTIRQYGHRKSDFIAQCTFDNENCFLNHFNEFEDPTYGKCFTFNWQTLVPDLKFEDLDSEAE